MLTIAELLTAAKAGAGLPSNYRLARVLGVSDNTLNRWQHARSFPDDSTAATLAEMAGLDAGMVVAAMHAQRAAAATAPALSSRAAICSHKSRSGPAAVVLSAGVVASPDAAAYALATAAPLIAGGALYIMLSRSRAAAGRGCASGGSESFRSPGDQVQPAA